MAARYHLEPFSLMGFGDMFIINYNGIYYTIPKLHLTRIQITIPHCEVTHFGDDFPRYMPGRPEIDIYMKGSSDLQATTEKEVEDRLRRFIKENQSVLQLSRLIGEMMEERDGGSSND
jgi:hypothetical protein